MMKSRTILRLLKLLKITGMTMVVLFILAVAGWSISRGYSISGTGFGNYTTPTGEFIRGKTLWDWMDLLIIPIFLGVGVFVLNALERRADRQQAKVRADLEREIATDRQRENALQSYIDRMADLLLKENLRTTDNQEVCNIARVRTLTLLSGLDPYRKSVVLLFLKESGLVEKNAIVDLAGADFSKADLMQVDLRDTNLQGAEFPGADLRSAQLNRATLQSTNFERADLRLANLSEADMTLAFLKGADMRGINLRDANVRYASLEYANLNSYIEEFEVVEKNDLSSHIEPLEHGTNFRGADFTDAYLHAATLNEEKLLSEAKSVRGAVMPDGTKHN